MLELCWSQVGLLLSLPVAPGEEELCWAFSGTGFKTQVVLVKQGWYVECLKKNRKKDFVVLSARHSSLAGRPVCHLLPQEQPKSPQAWPAWPGSPQSPAL